MVKIYKQPFAHDGDTIAIPDVSQPDGKMSNVDGWTPDYQLLKTDPNYKPVGRQEMNGVFKEVTEALGQVQVQGAASWSADGAPYPINAQVYHDGKQWIALRANSVEPAEGEDWSAVMPQKAVTDAINNNSIGVGQTWQYMTASRSAGTTYTNTGPRAIAVSIVISPNSSANLHVDGVYVSGARTEAFGTQSVTDTAVFAIVPAYSTYRLQAVEGYSVIVGHWSELR